MESRGDLKGNGIESRRKIEGYARHTNETQGISKECRQIPKDIERKSTRHLQRIRKTSVGIYIESGKYLKKGIQKVSEEGIKDSI